MGGWEREGSGQIDFGKVVGALWVGSQGGQNLDTLEAGSRWTAELLRGKRMALVAKGRSEADTLLF